MEAGAGLSSNRSEEVENGNLDMKRWADSQRDWHKDRRFYVFIEHTIGKEGLSIEIRRHLYENA